MSYQVLARKWRPKSFTEVVGQQHVLTILSNALSLGRIHHAYLFSGTRGVGKTSIARLFAKSLNCEAGITATPCGVCDNCVSIEQGRFVDLLEIDAASRTKVEDTREIIDNIQYLPTKGRFKVYLIDEVHMLSRSSFNALLKTLEEPPEHVKFLLATTDPQKLPVTILSRCLHLHLNILDTILIENQLAKILHAEHIDQQVKALQLIAKAANGSMRDALSLTDQAIALGNGVVDASTVAMMLGTLDRNVPFAIIEALYRNDGGSLMQHIEDAAKQGIDWDNLLVETIALLQQIAFLQIVPTALGDYADAKERIRYLAHSVPPNDVQLFYQILLTGRKELSYVPDKKLGVEMCFLRALAFTPKYFASTASEPEVTKIKESKQVNFSAPVIDTTNQIKAELDVPAKSQEIEVISSKTAVLKPDSPKKQPIENAVSDLTQSILTARQQLIDSEKKIKKSKQVESIQPEKQPVTLTQSQFTKEVPTQETNTFDLSSIDAEESNDETETAATYQWQFSEHFMPNAENDLNAKSVRSAFEHEKSAELIEKLINEAVEIDPWSAEIESLTLPPLIKQIAINSFLQQAGDGHLILHVRSDVSHLIKNQSNIKRLKESLSNACQQPLQVDLVIDDDETQLTPIEIREQIYQKKLTQAKQAVTEDSKITMLCQFFDAKIDDESIRPI